MTSGKLKIYQILTVSNLRVGKNTFVETKFLSLYATEYFTISRLLFLTFTLLKHNISVYKPVIIRVISLSISI